MNRESETKIALLVGKDALRHVDRYMIQAATYLAQDDDGYWFLYKDEPKYSIEDAMWLVSIVTIHRCLGYAPITIHPAHTLMRLP